MEKESLYWAIELWESNYKEYVWKRMLIISSEDVGLADPNIATQIWSLYQIYTFLAKKKDKHCPEKLHFVQAVVMLARCKKSRYVDMVLCNQFMQHEKTHIDVPEWAYDMHTLKGRQQGRSGKKGIVHFYESSAKINNVADVAGEKELYDEVVQTSIDHFDNKPQKDLFE
jgi:replication-associated recombination protein RarA